MGAGKTIDIICLIIMFGIYVYALCRERLDNEREI